jgi:hypothetical protein
MSHSGLRLYKSSPQLHVVPGIAGDGDRHNDTFHSQGYGQHVRGRLVGFNGHCGYNIFESLDFIQRSVRLVSDQIGWTLKK